MADVETPLEHATRVLDEIARCCTSIETWGVGLSPVMYAVVRPALDPESNWTLPSGKLVKVLMQEVGNGEG